MAKSSGDIHSYCGYCETVKPHYQMYEHDVCIVCARSEGIIAPVESAAVQVERVEKEKVRIESENSQPFNKSVVSKQVLAERELCRRKLLPFITHMNPDYEPGWVHADICERLERFVQDIVDRKSPRLMLFLPPRAGKSEIGSKMLPAWFLGRFPNLETIISSYSGDLASGFSRAVRNIFASEKFKPLFATSRLSPDSKAADKWATTRGGGMNAVGVSGSLSGKGGSLLICDDPHKDRNEAESETARQTVKDWYSSTFYTRRAPGAGILVIQTRWHEDDMSGWLLSEQQEKERMWREEGGSEYFDKWEVVKYPAIAEQDETYRKQGEALHPERFPIQELEMTKSALIPRDWQALYQQEPVSDDGDYFTKNMFTFYKPTDKPLDSEMRIYAAADLAISTKQSADYTVIAVVGIDRQQNIWLLNIYRGRYNALGIIDRLFEVQERYNPELFGIETGQIELTLEPFIQKAEQERGISLRYEKLKTRGNDKTSRARPIQGRMEQGKVFFPTVESTPWMPTLQNEMLKFPLGVHDDQVDALAWIGQMIMLFGIKNQKREKPKKSFRDSLYKYGGGLHGKKHKSGMAS